MYAKKQEGWAGWLRRTVSEISSFAVIFGSVNTMGYSCHTSAHNLGMKIGNCRTSTDDQNRGPVVWQMVGILAKLERSLT